MDTSDENTDEAWRNDCVEMLLLALLLRLVLENSFNDELPGLEANVKELWTVAAFKSRVVFFTVEEIVEELLRKLFEDLNALISRLGLEDLVYEETVGRVHSWVNLSRLADYLFD